VKPQVGDIWFNHLDKYHYLVLEDDYQMGIGYGLAYTMLILETGRIDHAYPQHFTARCYFVK